MKEEDKKKLNEKLNYRLNFNRNGPFFDMVASFFVASIGLNPTLEELMPKDKTYLEMKKSLPEIFQAQMSFDGKGIPGLTITPLKLLKDFEKLKRLDFEICTSSFCSMLIITTYESYKKFFCRCPMLEFFRHIRNACAHNNRFYFYKKEPTLPAKWRELEIDHTKKGKHNPLYGNKCFFDYLGGADPVILLNDIENHFREHQESSDIKP